ncbi:interleukin-15 receptor subunit alpha isoform X3 [Triplophysa dalaica]|uniref:interleukin-15 receptor subunit alpha isoform X3 n=1 Tax=Triplophysa dalaica TaxID=1582913 RepID=UPI0024E02DF8|nr:interleukin-15 receptor subunit alpha isoform X3 [Triplophysa dalaica]
MHVLIIFIFAMAEYLHNIAAANGVCDSLPQIENAMPVNSTKHVKDQIRFNCVDGFVRKAGTSNLFRCVEKNGKSTWIPAIQLLCIRDPKKPTHPPKTEETFTTSTTERAQTSRIPGTSMPSAESHKEGTFSDMDKSTIGGTVGVVVILCLTAVVFLLWWRSRHRASNATNDIQLHHSNNATCTYYIPVPVSDFKHCSAELNIADAADASTAVTK